MLVVDAKCGAQADPRTGPAAPDLSGSGAPVQLPVTGPASPRGGAKTGCCSADGGLGSALVAFLTVVILATVSRSRVARRRIQ
jgi:hypothetical protein